MKIAEVAPLYESVPPRLYGGTERVVSYLTEELVRKGHDVTLFASGDSQTSAELVSACPQSLRLDCNCRDFISPHVLMIEQVFQRADEFDIIHFHTEPFHCPLARRHRAPIVTTLHGRLDVPSLVDLFTEFSESRLVSISDSQRRPFSSANWIGTVHHGLPPDLLRYRSGRGEYVAFLGRISREKGPESAIEIARRAGMRLKISAKIDKPDRGYFESEIVPLLSQPHVEFIGEIGEHQKEEFLGEATALLFPIEWPEPFGLVMIESLACGTPVIAFPCGAVPEVIEDGVSGCIVSSVGEAVTALRSIDRFDRRACRRAFDERFTAERMAHDYLSLFQRTIATEDEPRLDPWAA